MNNLKKEFPNPVKNEFDNKAVMKIESDSDDSEIEMVAVVDNKKNKKYKAIKVEEQDDKKQARIKNGVSVHASHDQLGSQIYLSDRIRQFYDQKRLEITGKQPLISPLFMKGRIENPKYKTLKRTIPEDEIVNDNVKKAKSQGNVQVEVTNLPSDWVEEGLEKIRSIANAYGDP